jgi:hypothetical protein
MPATTGFTSIGAQLKLGDGTTPTEVFTHIGNTINFSLEQSADQIDATHLMSTSGYREYKAGYKTATVSFEGHFDPDSPQQQPPDGILGMFESGAPANFQADFSGADNGGIGAPATLPICSFAGVVTQFSITAPAGDMVTYAGTISMSTSPVWSDGTP